VGSWAAQPTSAAHSKGRSHVSIYQPSCTQERHSSASCFLEDGRFYLLRLSGTLPMSKVDGRAAKARAQLRRRPESVSRRSEAAPPVRRGARTGVLPDPARGCGLSGDLAEISCGGRGGRRRRRGAGQGQWVNLSQPASGHRWAASRRFPVSRRLHRTPVSIHASFTDSEIDRVRCTIRELTGIK